MKTCLIISGGEYSELPENLQYDYCIACDSGYEHAINMRILPDIVVGDFDSISQSFKSTLESKDRGIPVVTFPKEKDDTDTMLAIKHAIKMGCSHIILSCCLGGRYDHTMANIQSMKYIAGHKCSCELYGNGEWMRIITPSDGRCEIPKRNGYSLSLFALSDRCDNLSISGAKYSVSGLSLTNDFPMGHGNSWLDNVITISIGSGVLLLMESRMEEQ